MSILETLRTPYVVHLLENNKMMENKKWIVNMSLEHMSEGSLVDLVNKFGGFFYKNLVRCYTRQLLLGPHYLHSHEIVHCHLKSKNVLVGLMRVKRADFGTTARLENICHNIKTGHCLKQMKRHMLVWVAPEVVRHKEQGSASDI
ncbi:hypothetical protein O6H91_11G040000 [Diphasiastrum complanatum]|uniref:Uncharacterized protein n=1 Tax=Diphasiastrum complanatum TaxID=34168 RepID=A0ACC2C880_DIPCM|nr:hypothetical protein O6H91_11G040000 [Diphasiastrum complanatum]